MRKLRALGTAVIALAATAAHGTTYIVDVGGDNPPTFSPQTITIYSGDTITFINKGGLHNAKADDGSFRCANGCDATGGNGSSSSKNWAASVKFAYPGTIGYYCEQHGAPGQGMYGTIIVQPLVPVRLQSFEVD